MSKNWLSILAVLLLLFLLISNTYGDPPEGTRPRMETVPIRGMSFTMGTPIKKGEPEYHEDEAQQNVCVKDFRIGKFPVTSQQMCLFLNSEQARKYDRSGLYNERDIGKYTYSTITFVDNRYIPQDGAADAPVNQVTWRGAVLYCRWLSDETGKTFRLPSEAEWELAARGGKARKWPWGDDAPTAKHGPRYDDNIQAQLSWPRVSVGSHHDNATPDGVYDMLAYVIGEWCTNKYIEHPNPEQLADPATDLDDESHLRVVRGYYHRYYPRGGRLLRLTSYGWRSHLGRPWTRVGCHPSDEVKQAARHGFRVVEEVKEQEGM